jgi:hypothetical protein
MANNTIAKRLLMSKSEGKRPLGGKGRRRENTVEMDLAAIG